MESMAGQVFGDYFLGAPLGQGPTGQVLQARHVRLQRLAAVKVFERHLTATPGFQPRFAATLRPVAALRHPQIVEVYDVGEQNGQFFVAMELLAGSLRQLLRDDTGRQRSLVRGPGLDIARQLAEALAYAHAQGLIHGAIKPENVLMQPAGAGGSAQHAPLKLTDWGISQLFPDEALSAPAYLSPEQCQSLPTDTRSDIYSFGVVLYEIATGVPPFIVNSLAEAAQLHPHVPPAAARLLNPQIPAALETIILRCLAKRPDERYASGAELLAALHPLLAAEAARQPTQPAYEVATPAAPAAEPVQVECDQEQVVLTPGAQSLVTLRLLNNTSSSDAYALTIEGLPAEWVTAPESPVPVGPGSQSSVGLLLVPPRTAESTAGAYEVVVRARSVTTPARSGTLRMRWTVLPFTAASLAITPPREESRSEARYELLLRNEGNSAATFLLSVGSQQPDINVALAQNEVPLSPAQEVAIPLQVSAPQRLIGEQKLHPFEVRAEADGYALSASAEFVHWPAVRYWVPALLLAVVLLGVLVGRAILLARGDDATVGEAAEASASPAPTPTTEPGAPRVLLFSVAPPEVGPSEPVLVSWAVEGAERARGRAVYRGPVFASGDRSWPGV